MLVTNNPIYIGQREIIKGYKGNKLIYNKTDLPEGYTSVKSLINSVRSGGAYLDTGLIVKGTLKVRIRFRLNGETGAILGGRISNTSNAFTFSTGSAGNWNDGYRNGTADTGVPYDYQEHELVKDRGKTFLDGVQISNNSNNNFNSQRRLLVFSYDNNGTVAIPALMTLYELQIWDNDVLVRDYKLCKDQNNRGCLYDAVNKTITYSNSATDFTYEE